MIRYTKNAVVFFENVIFYVVSDQGHNICADKQSKPIYFLFNILRIAWDGDITLEETFYIYQSNTKNSLLVVLTQFAISAHSKTFLLNFSEFLKPLS